MTVMDAMAGLRVAIEKLQAAVDEVAPKRDRELRPTLNKPAGLYDNSFTCQRCGRKVGAASTTPADMETNYVCFHCSAGDEPRAE